MSNKGNSSRTLPEHPSSRTHSRVDLPGQRIKLQGQIESFDQYVVLLKNTVTQMVQGTRSPPSCLPARSSSSRKRVPTEPPVPRRGRRLRRLREARVVFERPASGERAVLVQLDLGQGAIDERLSS